MKRSISCIALACVISSLIAATAKAQDAVLPTDPVDGKSQAEWTQDWWNWAISYPNGANPITDATGADAQKGYSTGSNTVFFLAGSFSTPVPVPVVRTVNISSNRFLFFPILNTVSPAPFFGNTEAELRADASDNVGIPTNLSVRLDGVDITLPLPTTSLADYRQLSPPGLFDLVIPENNIYGVPSGSYPSVSDGYWVALNPLTPGNHTLHFETRSVGTGAYDGQVFTQDITYIITSAAAPEPGSFTLVAFVGLLVGGSLIRRTKRK